MSWICLPMGMYMPALRPPHTVPEGDNRLLQIRARRRVDLDRMRRELLPELGETINLPHTDYEYRAYCTHEQWAAAMARAAMDIDYVKFKEQSETKYKDKKLHDVYTAMWYTVFSKMSTKVHQSSYWDSQNRLLKGVVGRGKGKNRPAGTSRWWEDAAGEQPATLRDLIDRDHGINEYQITQDDLDRIAPKEWDDEMPAVSRRPNGTIDHSYCDHNATKAARRRCRDRNR